MPVHPMLRYAPLTSSTRTLAHGETAKGFSGICSPEETQSLTATYVLVAPRLYGFSLPSIFRNIKSIESTLNDRGDVVDARLLTGFSP